MSTLRAMIASLLVSAASFKSASAETVSAATPAEVVLMMRANGPSLIFSDAAWRSPRLPA